MPHSRPSTPGLLTVRQTNAWFRSLGAAFFGDGTSAADMRASVSWRVTVPLRRVHARERLQLVRSGRLPVLTGEAADPTVQARSALRARLGAVAPHLLGPAASALRDAPLEELLTALVSHVHPRDDVSEVWLLTTAISGCIPDDAMLQGLVRDLRGTDAAGAALRFLGHSGTWMREHDTFLRTIEVVTDRPVAFVDFTARHGFNSGVQRVTREIVRVWTAEKRSFALAALTDDTVGLRALRPDEDARVRDWHQDRAGESTTGGDRGLPLIVPWSTTVFLPEVPGLSAATTLSSVARFSGNRTVALGYDAIPATSGHTVGDVERLRFASYLALVKHLDEVVAISGSAGEEFSGIGDALSAQGLTGPRVRAILLPLEGIPADLPERTAAEQPATGGPVVLAVGSNERRKNHIAILFAAEVLWREGEQFSLVLMGGAGGADFTEVGRAASALVRRGRALSVRHDVSESELAEAYATARFSVFLSLHEGYGLPVAESLAAGTPVVTTGFGSTAEIAAGGGCLSVDPRDDEAVIDALRRMLHDDTLLDELRAQIAARVDLDWAGYADAVWAIVTETTGAQA